MELHHRSCVLPSNDPSRVLQERSGNRRRGYADSSSSWKREASSPTANLYSQRLGGNYFSGNFGAQLNGEKSEEQISYETKRLLHSLQRCEKYKKYRERQPQNAKEREQKWPEKMEEAFFRALVRWPPMGRRKLMLDGQLRGRNELVADSIHKETGQPRTRKQVSSHIQVLKNFFSDRPDIAIYMSTEDMGGRRNRHANAHLGHLRSRHGFAQTKIDSPVETTTSNWDGYGYSSSSSRGLLNSSATYTVTDFAMWVLDSMRMPVHYLSTLANPPRLGDLHITDITSWYKQYPEFSFHRTDAWNNRQVLVCDASIKITTARPPKGAELAVQFVLDSTHDLSIYEPLQCRTRFYDDGKLAEQKDKDDQTKHETIGICTTEENTHRPRIPIGSNFWAHRIATLSSKLRSAGSQVDPSLRGKTEDSVRDSLQRLTAAQDIWAIRKDTGESHCILTILWRFKQSRDAGRMSWRVANFVSLPEQPWIKPEDAESRALMAVASTAATNSLYSALPLDFPHQPFAQHPTQLDLESLSASALEGMSDFSNPTSATAPSLATDYSQTHSLPSLAHSHDVNLAQPHDYQDTNDIDFTGGHINLCLEPAINLGAYENYSHAPTLNPLNPIAGLEGIHNDTGFGDLGLGVTMANCYPTRPSWLYQDVVSRFEGMAEQPQNILENSHSDNIAGHGVLHDGQLNPGLWKLQTGFGEDASVGADHRGKDESLSQMHGHAILDMIERDQRARADKFRAF